ncbi:hypothetical protein [Streptomyces sp. NPDC059278]|uniref:hypothetical protein n=1 Tax=Streptomyces sp. NPDC059278 TaxID=3346801 RepID=UPI0036BF355A
MDSDEADELEAELVGNRRSTPQERGEMLAVRLALLSVCNPAARRVELNDADVLEETKNLGVAACAIVHDKATGAYCYVLPPSGDGGPDLSLDMLPHVSPYMLWLATSAISLAQALVDHPDVDKWCGSKDRQEHRDSLRLLSDRLYAVARRTPGHPAYIE